MSSMQHVYRVSHGGWQHCHGRQVRDVLAWPRLKHPALVVLDLDEVHTDVWRFDGKGEYASALIEKRVRQEGLVEGETHIVVHRLLTLPGGFQAYFSAVPLELWQRALQWSDHQRDHALVMLAPGMLCHGVGVGQCRVWVAERRWQAFAQTDAGMVYRNTQGLGRAEDALESAAQLLAANLVQALPLGVRLSGQVGAFWAQATPGAAESAAMPVALETLRDSLGSGLSLAPHAVLVPQGDGAQRASVVHTLLPQWAPRAASAHAQNPALARMAWRAERWVGALTLFTAVVGGGLLGMGVYAHAAARAEQRATAMVKTELEALQGRVQAVAAFKSPEELLPVAEFARLLDDGKRHDPVDLLGLLKRVTGPDMHLHRVRLDGGAGKPKSYRIDGQVALGAARAVSDWTASLAAAGWTLRALEPVDAGVGAFSYELVAAHAAAKP